MCELPYRQERASSSRFALTKGIVCIALFCLPHYEYCSFFGCIAFGMIGRVLVPSRGDELWVVRKSIYLKYSMAFEIKKIVRNT